MLSDKKSGHLVAAHKWFERPQLHRGVDSLLQYHFLVFFEPLTFVQTFVFVLVGSIAVNTRAFYHHDASCSGKIFRTALYI
jgi:hypothetical protein